ncbi:phosphodiesterase [Naumannella sp. ID2617S]|uniref:Phosphodiesterase n=2 Tax=Enemella dayhoffiae TaxID=2016507 RepID=A0A255H4M1_9ACTN|nr:phosphodiesterase [Naumannella sp. ID2617S]OYO22213.1 phosphodiesterase [Enemella dayhoffiae]
MHASSDRRSALSADLASCGYFPELVEDTVLLAVGPEEVIDFVVHHEPTFNHDEIRRHLTVLVLTPTRLVVGHTDEQPGEAGGSASAATSTESIALHSVHTVALTRVVNQPERYRHGDPAYEAWLSVAWGAMHRMDLEPAGCPDPNCEADHGYTGTMVPDDLVVRMSVAADGIERVGALVSFAITLQQATGRGSVSTRIGG